MESFHIFEWKVKEIPDKCYHSWYYLCCDHLTRIIDWPLEENNEKSIFYILGVDSQKLQNKNWQMLHSWHYLWCCGFWDLSIWPRYWIYPGKSKNTRLFHFSPTALPYQDLITMKRGVKRPLPIPISKIQIWNPLTTFS